MPFCIACCSRIYLNGIHTTRTRYDIVCVATTTTSTTTVPRRCISIYACGSDGSSFFSCNRLYPVGGGGANREEGSDDKKEDRIKYDTTQYTHMMMMMTMTMMTKTNIRTRLLLFLFQLLLFLLLYQPIIPTTI